MDHNLPAVLLMGGGEGMGPVKKTAKALGEALFDESLEMPIGQIVVICGRNQLLASALQSIQWKVPIKVSSFPSLSNLSWLIVLECLNGYSMQSYIHVCRLEDLRLRWRNGWELATAL